MVSEDTTILFVTSLQLYPIAGGGVSRVWAMVDYFRSRGLKVEVVMVRHNGEAYEALGKIFDRLWVYDPKGRINKKNIEAKFKSNKLGKIVLQAGRPVAKGFKQVARTAKGIVSNSIDNPDSGIQLNRKAGFEEYAAKIIRQTKPQAIIAECVWTARCFDAIPPNALKILDTIDIQHMRFPSAKEAGYDVSRLVCTREEEVRELERADILLAIQEEEAGILQEMCPRQRVLVVEHAHRVHSHVRPPKEAKTVLFVGNFYEPNNIGLKNFIQQAWPVIHKAHLDARFVVCGKVCQSYEGQPPEGVEFKGLVPCLDEFYEAATVVVNPIPFGTGLKIKTVEALAQGKCLVSNECGILGLPFPTLENPYCILAPVEEMGDRISELFSDPDKRRACEEAALRLAERRFSPQACYEELTEIIERVPCY
jgi:glycosyltransferase involved in cell wall biosynthesis